MMAIAKPEHPVHERSLASEVEGRSLISELPAPRTRLRINWQLKTLLPVAAALLNGLLLFVLLTISLDPGPRHSVIAFAAAGAFVICAIIMATLGYFVRRPML